MPRTNGRIKPKQHINASFSNDLLAYFMTILSSFPAELTGDSAGVLQELDICITLNSAKKLDLDHPKANHLDHSMSIQVSNVCALLLLTSQNIMYQGPL